jgi:hypothetical protein
VLLDDVIAEARSHYRWQASLSQKVMAIVRKLWAKVDPADIAGSFSKIFAKLLDVITEAQQEAAAAGAAYVGAALAAQAVTPDPIGAVIAASLAGVASDGRRLDTLATLPVIRAKTLIGQGMSVPEAMRIAEGQLLTIVSTQVADAGRVATGMGIALDRMSAGYQRVLTLPSCSRCIVLAGRVYTWSDGFQRHPRCDCIHVPITVADYDRGGVSHSPEDIFAGMSSAEQNKVFGVAGAESIRRGADLGQVVNARRGMIEAGGRKYTSDGVTARGIAGKRLGQLQKRRGSRYRVSNVPRLMPEQIFTEAKGDREEAARLLKRFGYIV